MIKFGYLNRSKREEKKMLLRHSTAELDFDTSLISKIERGEKTSQKEHVLYHATLLKINPHKSLTPWLVDQGYSLVEGAIIALGLLDIAKSGIVNNNVH